MNVAITNTRFEVPARASLRQDTAPAVEATISDDSPRLGGLAHLVGLVTRGLTASWVPFCPDLTTELGRRYD